MKMFWPVLAYLIIFLIASSRVFSGANMKDFNIAWQLVVNSHQQGLKDYHIVGSSLMFIHDNKTIGKSIYGFADERSQRPVDENTIFHWASITKTFTGIGIMQLRDRGLLRLDDAVVDYLPELKKVYNPYGSMSTITIRQIMSHTAGFRGPTWPWGGDKNWQPFEPTAWEQLVAMFPYTEIRFAPGSQYSYSNPAIIFLGRIIELLSGEDYEVYIDKHILKPLQMYNSYFDLTPPDILPQRSNSYYIKEDSLIENGLDFDTGITVSNSGLNAPLTDMLKYLSFLVNSSDKQFTILKRSSLQEMWQKQISLQEEASLWTAVGLSFFIYEKDRRLIIGHTGSQHGFISFILADPEQHAAATAAFNTLDLREDGISNTEKLSLKIQNLIVEKIFPLF
jgi:CubicO group peptidase (beta-lactamase class C family)